MYQLTLASCCSLLALWWRWRCLARPHTRLMLEALASVTATSRWPSCPRMEMVTSGRDNTVTSTSLNTRRGIMTCKCLALPC